MAVTRAGATTLFELLALRKPALLIPLSRQASRGDQIENARSFGDRRLCRVLPEEELVPGMLVKGIDELYGERRKIADAMEEYPAGNGVEDAAWLGIRALRRGTKIEKQGLRRTVYMSHKCQEAVY